jgi:hypothetical protein
MRNELTFLQNFIDNDQTFKLTDQRIQGIGKVLERDKIGEKDLVWVYENLYDIEDDLVRYKRSQKMYKQLIIEKDLEIAEIKQKSSFCNFKTVLKSPSVSKVSTVSCSPYTSIEDWSSIPHSPSKKTVSFVIKDSLSTKQKLEISQEDDSKIISELATIKLKFALFDEFISKRDNQIKYILRQLIKNTHDKDYLARYINFIIQKLSINSNYFNE